MNGYEQAQHQRDLHNPNHADILRGLWPLLAMLVSVSGDQPIAPQVLNPLLTEDAVNMLNSCLSSQERDLWRTLGEAWTVPRLPFFFDNSLFSTTFVDFPLYLLSISKE